MSLYGRTDSNANVAKAGRGIAASSQSKTVVFIDETEAALESNKKRGLNAPGWWSYFTYTDSSGATRHKAEHLVTLANADLNANETQSDDAIAGDAATAITIGTQPADQDTSSGAATFTVAATTTGSGATLTYQWQKSTDAGLNFVNVANATSASLVLAGQTAAENGDQYRVRVNNSIGADEVISSVATLTFVD
jgi:hypothetical protein|tara:strand:+ start:1189 stop:1770 length:582 start_codon:yes stop_codon:yes gene_type:complete